MTGILRSRRFLAAQTVLLGLAACRSTASEHAHAGAPGAVPVFHCMKKGLTFC
jgi:hypothetical protein